MLVKITNNEKRKATDILNVLHHFRKTNFKIKKSTTFKERHPFVLFSKKAAHEVLNGTI